ncbi:unnamed protein product [Trichogramma brassicae]|uniref:Uncharacterized protein n=1 Tax=Trichogramma brassicae TaxID=86971 RepID=A0A6H5I746_9HYME|nr:unnamed protein product [Trichogramma brassicae]
MSRRIRSAGKIGESKACTIIVRIRSSILSPIARRVGNWSYRQRKETESCATLTISRAAVISVLRRPSIASSVSLTGVACIPTSTNTFARAILASAIRSIRLVRVDLWGDALSSNRGPMSCCTPCQGQHDDDDVLVLCASSDSNDDDEARGGPTKDGFKFPPVAEIQGNWSDEDWDEGVDEGAFPWPASWSAERSSPQPSGGRRSWAKPSTEVKWPHGSRHQTRTRSGFSGSWQQKNEPTSSAKNARPLRSRPRRRTPLQRQPTYPTPKRQLPLELPAMLPLKQTVAGKSTPGPLKKPANATTRRKTGVSENEPKPLKKLVGANAWNRSGTSERWQPPTTSPNNKRSIGRCGATWRCRALSRRNRSRHALRRRRPARSSPLGERATRRSLGGKGSTSNRSSRQSRSDVAPFSTAGTCPATLTSNRRKAGVSFAGKRTTDGGHAKRCPSTCTVGIATGKTWIPRPTVPGAGTATSVSCRARLVAATIEHRMASRRPLGDLPRGSQYCAHRRQRAAPRLSPRSRSHPTPRPSGLQLHQRPPAKCHHREPSTERSSPRLV